MQQFFCGRVELHNTFSGDREYVVLHAAMERQGFFRVIAAHDGKRYNLPPAEYVHAASTTLDGVLTRARAALISIGRLDSATVVIFQCDNWIGVNMTQA
jgi:hypothetical protein